MKLVSLLTGAAAVALIATSASAQSTAPSYATYVNPANPASTGTALTSVQASFSISGTVAPSCVLGNNGPDMNDVNFGNIGVNADGSQGIENAFNMVGAINGHSRTNIAGCNTSNRVTVNKSAAGLTNASAAASGYDTAVFQANLPYSLAVQYTSGDLGHVGTSGSISRFSVGTGATGNSRDNNAFRSGLAVRIDIPAPTKALVAGEYTDTVLVTIQTI